MWGVGRAAAPVHCINAHERNIQDYPQGQDRNNYRPIGVQYFQT